MASRLPLKRYRSIPGFLRWVPPRTRPRPPAWHPQTNPQQ